MLSQMINAHGNSIHQSQTLEADYHLKGARCHQFHILERMSKRQVKIKNTQKMVSDIIKT